MSVILEDYQRNFLELAFESGSLKFGRFVLNNRHNSPYVFNLGEFNTGKLLTNLATFYAVAIIQSHIKFDVIFGPAYNGIPLASVACMKLAEIGGSNYQDIRYAFNRNETKRHGEGGNIVGSSIMNKKVLVIGDVMTAGKGIDETFKLIYSNGGQVVAYIIALDERERTDDNEKDEFSAIQSVNKRYGVPVLSIVTLLDALQFFEDKMSVEQRKLTEEYIIQYGIN